MIQKELQEKLGDLLDKFDFMDQIRDGQHMVRLN